MFPLIPVDSQTGHFGDWGLPYHGLLTFLYHDPNGIDQGASIPGGIDRSTLQTHPLPGAPGPSGTVLNSITFPAQDKFVGSSTIRKLVVPGHTYTRDPARESDDDFLGVDFRSFGIVGMDFIGGFENFVNPNNGWIYVDPQGDRWSVVVTSTVTGTGNNAAYARWVMSLKPWGISRLPVSFYGVESEPDLDPGQPEYVAVVEGDSGLTLWSDGAAASPQVLDINSDGSRSLWTFQGRQNDNYENFNRASLGSVPNQRKSMVKVADTAKGGYAIVWELQLAGTPGDDFTFGVVVKRTQDQCKGTLDKNEQERTGDTIYWGGNYFTECAPIASSDLFSRPNQFNPESCPPLQHPSIASMGHVTLLFGGGIEDAIACGWDRLLKNDESVAEIPQNLFNSFRWWQFTDPGLFPASTGELWEASAEYVVGSHIIYGEFVFTCTVAHTSDALKQPAVGVLWPSFWEVEFDAFRYDLSEIPLYDIGGGVEVTISTNVVHDGSGNYYIAKGDFFTWDGDPDNTNHDQPGVGENWENFWDGPLNPLLSGTEWFPEKVIRVSWIIPHGYDEPSFPTEKTLANASWECIRTHVSDASNEPGVGANWPLYWKHSFGVGGTFSTWTPPIIYSLHDRVHLDIDGGPSVDDRTYRVISTLPFTSTDANKPPHAFWEEVADVPDCFATVYTSLLAGLGIQSYHVSGHQPTTEALDIHFKNITVGMMYKNDDTIRLFEVDARYVRDFWDGAFDHWWDTGCRPHLADPEEDACTLTTGDTETWEGLTTRGAAKADETLFFDFRVDGNIDQTITFISKVTATGSDSWSEKHSTYPSAWSASGTRTRTFNQNGIETVNINETFTQDDTAWAGQTGDDILVNNKAGWKQNDFVSGKTFEWIDNPPMDHIRNKFVNAASAESGGGLAVFPGGSVSLGDISNVDQYTNPHPFRSEEQIADGDPFPMLAIVNYGNKLIGPMVWGRKSNSGIALDSQYHLILRPDDMPWVQYGVYGPDNQSPDVRTLTFGSPVNPLTSWIPDAIYGDDVSCAYDPITFAIERNNQYRVTFV